MADQQLKDNKIQIFNVRVRQYLRKHYKPSKGKYFAICIYCLSGISYRPKYTLLLHHLTMRHPEVLTEEQKTNRNVHWAWDYFTPTSFDDAQCNICSKLCKSNRMDYLTIHLASHRDKHVIFNPDEDTYQDTYMHGASTSASGSMIVEVAEYQEASIPIAFNLTDDTDRTCVPNESATKTSEPSEYVTNSSLEHTVNIKNIEKEFFAELEYDTKELLPGREELPVGEEIPIRQEFPKIGELLELVQQSSDDIHNFYSPDPECQFTYDLPKKE